MKLFDSFSEPGFHSSIVTTFGVDFGAYESIVLGRLREVGCHNNVLIADDRMLGMSLGDAFRRPAHAGRRYSVTGAASTGVFHPKLVLQLGKKVGRLLVASANMTSAGLAGNLEVVGSVSASETDRQAIPIFQSAIAYLQQFLGHGSVARRQFDWAMHRTPWLKAATDTEVNATVELDDGRRLSFVVNTPDKGIGERFLELIGQRQVKRLVVASPYWDPSLAALTWMQRRLDPEATAVLVQPDSALFPVHALPRSRAVLLFDANKVKGTVSSRFAHAKMFIAEVDGSDCVLFGSANCTLAALGGEDAPGANEEVCLYRELPSGHATQLLGMNEALTDAARIATDAMLPYEQTEEIPLDALGRKLPGRFELSGNILKWWPPSGATGDDAELKLLDQHGAPNDGELVRLHRQNEAISYRFAGDELPYFAQIQWPEVESSIAVIVVEQAIQQSQRRIASKAVENALAFLDDEEAFEGLWLLELIDTVASDQAEYRPKGSTDASDDLENEDVQHEAKTLPYAEFIAGRDISKGVEAGSQLATTQHEPVRGFLNALLGLKNQNFLIEEVDPPGPDLSTPGEPDNPEDSVDQGEQLEIEPLTPHPNALNSDQRHQLRRQQAYYKDTQKTIADAVHRFIADVQRRVTSDGIEKTDLLRLRVLLMVVLGAGSKKSVLLPTDPTAKISRRQVLASQGEFGWPSLVGRLLFAFFRTHAGSHDPLVKKIKVEQNGECGIPADILECWATCFWAAGAVYVAIDDKNQRLKQPLKKQEADEDLYRVTRLPIGENLGERTTEFFYRLNQRFAERLGVSADEITVRHQMLVKGKMTSGATPATC